MALAPLHTFCRPFPPITSSPQLHGSSPLKCHLSILHQENPFDEYYPRHLSCANIRLFVFIIVVPSTLLYQKNSNAHLHSLSLLFHSHADILCQYSPSFNHRSNHFPHTLAFQDTLTCLYSFSRTFVFPRIPFPTHSFAHTFLCPTHSFAQKLL